MVQQSLKNVYYHHIQPQGLFGSFIKGLVQIPLKFSCGKSTNIILILLIMKKKKIHMENRIAG